MWSRQFSKQTATYMFFAYINIFVGDTINLNNMTNIKNGKKWLLYDIVASNEVLQPFFGLPPTGTI